MLTWCESFSIDMEDFLFQLAKIITEEQFNSLDEKHRLHIQAHDEECRTHGFSGAVYQEEN